MQFDLMLNGKSLLDYTNLYENIFNNSKYGKIVLRYLW